MAISILLRLLCAKGGANAVGGGIALLYVIAVHAFCVSKVDRRSSSVVIQRLACKPWESHPLGASFVQREVPKQLAEGLPFYMSLRCTHFALAKWIVDQVVLSFRGLLASRRNLIPLKPPLCKGRCLTADMRRNTAS